MSERCFISFSRIWRGSNDDNNVENDNVTVYSYSVWIYLLCVRFYSGRVVGEVIAHD